MNDQERLTLFNRAAVAQYIRATKKMGLSSNEGSEILGVSINEIELYLRGEGSVPEKTLTKMLIITGISKALSAAFPNEVYALQWLNTPRSIMSETASPLTLMRSVEHEDVMKVLNYLQSLDSSNSPKMH